MQEFSQDINTYCHKNSNVKCVFTIAFINIYLHIFFSIQPTIHLNYTT